MTAAPAPNPRASLLAGLRTGGVRSASSPLASAPHTAAPGATFNVPRFTSQNGHIFLQHEESDEQLIDVPSQNSFAGAMTAAVDGPNNKFTQQQRGMNPNSVPFSPGFQTPSAQVQAQALQMQMMQLEIIRLQSIHAQQYQAELLAQAQRQQQSQARRSSLNINPPASAGPLSNGFDLRTATMRRANQAEQLKSQLGVAGDNSLPMSAALGGKFGSRTTSLHTPSSLSKSVVEESDDSVALLPPTPNSTTVISGGTSLGNPTSNNIVNTGATTTAVSAPSKSESAVSWRRGGNNNSVLSGNNRVVTSPSVKITPPPGEHASPPAITAAKSRPVPLRFSIAASQPLPAVAIDTSSDGADGGDGDDAESTSSSKSASNSSPTTPRSASSNDMPLSPREEAAKKLYEGLGIGRPAPIPQAPSVMSHRMASQPMRQPRGPPSGADELGPKNFATRIRRKAIGGLGVLMGARERREFVEAY